MKYFGYKIGVQFNNTPLLVQKNNYMIETLHSYIVYDLENWPIILLRNVTLTYCFFVATNIAKNSDKSKWMYRGYGIGEWNFGNDSDRNIVIFGVDNSSSYDAYNRKNDF